MDIYSARDVVLAIVILVVSFVCLVIPGGERP